MKTTIIIIVIIIISIGLSHQSELGNPFQTSLKLICDKNPNTCYEYLSQFHYNRSVQGTIDEISRAHESFTRNGMLSGVLEDAGEGLLPSTIESCRGSLSRALYSLDSLLAAGGGALTTRESRANVVTGLSAAGAHLQTCLDGLKYATNEVRELVASNLDKATELLTDSIAIVSRMGDRTSSHYQEPPGSSELASDWDPAWSSSNDNMAVRKPRKTMKADVVVAKDGSGKYRTIGEAINAVPPQSDKRFVIHVKKGVYNENVVVRQEKWNVLMYGDGMDNTIVSSNRCNQSGSSTPDSATFAVFGKGFIAKNIGFRNSAGSDKGQAVALLSASDQSVFYKCKMEGYQDTLCTHSNRQFYRECKIYGTMDFIFGEGVAVFQKSDILVRRPTNTITTIITAQGKWNPQSISGIVIQNCNIMAAEDLGNVKTFLGRPWKDYATVIVMQSKLGSLIEPAGWSSWEHNVRIPDTVHYVENDNSGPGAGTRNRVSNKGVIVKNAAKEVSKFTVRSFINGDLWIPSTGVPFEADLGLRGLDPRIS